MSIQNKSVGTHKAAYMAYHGDIPEGMVVMHKCDIRLCINPDHLMLGTCADNNRDCSRKGRTPDRRGEKNTQAKLSRADIIESLEMLQSGMSQREVARRFGICQQHVSEIATGKQWNGIRRTPREPGGPSIGSLFVGAGHSIPQIEETSLW